MNETIPEPPTAKVAAALAKAQAEFPAIARDATGHFGAYASLAAIIEATRGPLAANGLALTQIITIDGILETRLIHSSGEELSARVNVGQAAGKWQEWGKGVTYARRYVAQALLGVAGGDEDVDDSGKDAERPQDKPDGKWTMGEDFAYTSSGTWRNERDKQRALMRLLMRETEPDADSQRAVDVCAVNSELIEALPEAGEAMLLNRLEKHHPKADGSGQ